MKSLHVSSDSVGIVASGLCMVHCIATPILIVCKTTCAASCQAAPLWWRSFDILFLVISLFAVIYSVKITSKQWVKNALIASWSLLFLSELFKNLTHIHFVHYLAYIPATALIVTHLYNRKLCCSAHTC